MEPTFDLDGFFSVLLKEVKTGEQLENFKKAVKGYLEENHASL